MANAPATPGLSDPEQWVDLHGDYLFKYALMRLRDPAKRLESIVARGTLRRVLGLVTATPPAQLKFVFNPHGKPALVQQAGEALVGFNVSHTRGMVLVGVAINRHVGVDVEQVRPDFAW